MKLVIVESPTKARTLSRFLGEGYQIEASLGHIRDLPKNKLGVDLDHDFAPEYVLVSEKEEVVKKLKAEAKRASEVYLSMDPDREGEAIAFHVQHLIDEDGKFKRVVFHQITRNAIEEAFAHPRLIDSNLVDAQQARRVLDRLVGYTLSPLLWRKVRRGLSAGRVQSVAVRLIVEREREIEAFVPEEFWEIFCQVKSQKQKAKNPEFIIGLLKIDGEKAKVVNQEQADRIVADLNKASYVVTDVLRKEARKVPFPPFTTSTLQQAASNVLGFSAKRTMRLAQSLYEMGHITYHRTDSVHLAPEAVTKSRKLIEKQFGKEYLPEKPRLFRVRSKLAQEAHEAIRPTRVSVDAGSIKLKAKTANDLRKLYGLIWKRFLASQMSDAVYDQTTVNVEATPQQSGSSQVARSVRAFGSEVFDREVLDSEARTRRAQTESAQSRRDDASDFQSVSDASKPEPEWRGSHVYMLRATGSIRKFDGWRKLYKRSSEDRELPEVTKGESLLLLKVFGEQKFTEPPPRYTDASLVRALEQRGIGRPSTYAPTISTILARQYVEYEERKFKPTPVGMATNDFLVSNFEQIVDYDFTAGMEEGLDKIAQGERSWVPVIREFWGPFNKKVESVGKNAKRVAVPTESTGKKCPECGEGEEVIRVGRFGKFLSCSRFPNCKYTANYVEKLEGMQCPEDGGDIVIKRTRRGKQFYGCSNYPKCKWASWRKPR